MEDPTNFFEELNNVTNSVPQISGPKNFHKKLRPAPLICVRQKIKQRTPIHESTEIMSAEQAGSLFFSWVEILPRSLTRVSGAVETAPEDLLPAVQGCRHKEDIKEESQSRERRGFSIRKLRLNHQIFNSTCVCTHVRPPRVCQDNPEDLIAPREKGVDYVGIRTKHDTSRQVSDTCAHGASAIISNCNQ